MIKISIFLSVLLLVFFLILNQNDQNDQCDSEKADDLVEDILYSEKIINLDYRVKNYQGDINQRLCEEIGSKIIKPHAVWHIYEVWVIEPPKKHQLNSYKNIFSSTRLDMKVMRFIISSKLTKIKNYKEELQSLHEVAYNKLTNKDQNLSECDYISIQVAYIISKKAINNVSTR